MRCMVKKIIAYYTRETHKMQRLCALARMKAAGTPFAVPAVFVFQLASGKRAFFALRRELIAPAASISAVIRETESPTRQSAFP